MPNPLRIGAVPYVNAWPLLYGLEGRSDVRLQAAEPAALGPMLRRGEVDVALVPAIEYFRLSADSQERARPYPGRLAAPPRFVVLPVAAIGSRGRCGSVRLFGYAEMEKVRRVLLDPASRSSNALAQVLLVRRFGVRAHYVFPREAGQAPARRPDAELVIGDRGLVAERPQAEWTLDLGVEWNRFVHLPFVFAVWAARGDAPLAEAAAILREAREAGLEAREALAERAQCERGIPAELALDYLLHEVRYDFGRKQREGLTVFYRMAAQEGLAPEGGRLRLGPEA